MTTRRTTFTDLRTCPTFKLRALTYFLIFSLSTPTHGITLGQLKGIEGFQAAALAVALVNKAMREASENPMDTWRRQNVANAVGMMPLAIRALAQEFKSNKLHDGDLKFVTGILGGFVDVSAPDTFQKFMKTPDKSLIPRLGAGFPEDILKKAETQGLGKKEDEGQASGKSIVFDDTAKKSSSDTLNDLRSSISPLLGPEVINLSDSKFTSGTSGERRDGANSTSTVFNDSAQKEPSGYGLSAKDKGSVLFPGAEGQGFSLGKNNPSTFEYEITRDIATAQAQSAAQIEGQSLSGATVVGQKPKVEKSSLSESFFAKKEAAPKLSLSRRERARYKTKIRPKYWKVVPLLMLLVKEAEAAPAPAPAPAAAAAAGPAAGPASDGGQGGSGCQGGGQCGGGGSGGGGNGGGGQGSGGGAADLLFGLAAIIAAAAPMVAAAVQASSDKSIARINAVTETTLAQITANTSKYQTDSLSRTAERQDQVALTNNKLNNDAQTQRFAMQVKEIRDGREQAYQSELARRAEERRLNDERVALAQREAADTLTLERAKFNAAVTQAGLSTGFANVARPGGNLAVQKNIQAGTISGFTPAINNTTGNFGSGFGDSNFSGPSLALNANTNTDLANDPSSLGLPSTGQAFTGQGEVSLGQQAGMRAAASERLLASVPAKNFFSSAEKNEEEKTLEKDKPTAVIRQRITNLRGFRIRDRGRGAFSARGALQNGLAYSNEAVGSTRDFSVKTGPLNDTRRSDLASFATETKGSTSFVGQTGMSELPNEVRGSSSRNTTSVSSTNAYNPPDLGRDNPAHRAVFRQQ